MSVGLLMNKGFNVPNWTLPDPTFTTPTYGAFGIKLSEFFDFLTNVSQFQLTTTIFGGPYQSNVRGKTYLPDTWAIDIVGANNGTFDLQAPFCGPQGGYSRNEDGSFINYGVLFFSVGAGGGGILNLLAGQGNFSAGSVWVPVSLEGTDSTGNFYTSNQGDFLVPQLSGTAGFYSGTINLWSDSANPATAGDFQITPLTYF